MNYADEALRNLRAVTLVPDVVPNNIPPRRRNGVLTYLTDTIPNEHKATLRVIEETRAKLAELEEQRAFYERVAGAAGISLEDTPNAE